MALIKCPECGKEVSSKAKACPNCGNPVAEELEKQEQKNYIRCPECDYPNKDDSDFCEKCGYPLKNDDYEDSDNICEECGAHNKEDSVFCEKCGNALKRSNDSLTLEDDENKLYCSECGYGNEPESSFCERCGAELVVSYQDIEDKLEGNSIVCPDCGRENDVNSLFCEVCGYRLQDGEIEDNKVMDQETYFECPNCGYPNESGSVFCEKCGVELEIATTEMEEEKELDSSKYNECPNCGYLNDLNSRFCEKCGAELELPVEQEETQDDENYIECKSCGYKNEEGSRFCEKCGNLLEEIENNEELGPTEQEESVEQEEEEQEEIQDDNNYVECKSCGHKNEEGSRFCENCGEEIESSEELEPTEKEEQEESVEQEEIQDDDNYVECKSCGHKNEEGSRFCENCGEEIESSEEIESTEKEEQEESVEQEEIQDDEEGYILCPKCNFKNDLDAKFCESCGVNFIVVDDDSSDQEEKYEETIKEDKIAVNEESRETVYCEMCGTKNDVKAKRCVKCLARIKKSNRIKIASPLVSLFFILAMAAGTMLFASTDFLDRLTEYKIFNNIIFDNIFLGCVSFGLGLIVLLHMFINDGFSIKSDLKYLVRLKLSKFHAALIFIVCGFLLVLNVGYNTCDVNTYYVIGLTLLVSVCALFGLFILKNWGKFGTLYKLLVLLLSLSSFGVSAWSIIEGTNLNSDVSNKFKSLFDSSITNPGDNYYYLGFIFIGIGLLLLLSFVTMLGSKKKNND